MQFSLSVLALVASILSVNAEHSHAQFHKRTHAKPMEKRAVVVANSQISSYAANPNFADAVEGNVPSMPFQNTIVNNSTQDATVFFWTGEEFAFPITPYNPNPATPALIVSLPAGASKVVSFSSSFSGAYAPVFPNTQIQAGGGIQHAWVELTTTGSVPVIDVSMLPDMSSKWTSVQTDNCVSDITSCSFFCNDGSPSCWTAPICELKNCQGPYHVFDAGANGAGPWNGGCQLSRTFTTTFSTPE